MLLIQLTSLEEGHHFFSGHMVSERTHFAIHHFIDDPRVGESASGHDFVVASSGSVGVEVVFVHLPLQ